MLGTPAPEGGSRTSKGKFCGNGPRLDLPTQGCLEEQGQKGLKVLDLHRHCSRLKADSLGSGGPLPPPHTHTHTHHTYAPHTMTHTQAEYTHAHTCAHTRRPARPLRWERQVLAGLNHFTPLPPPRSGLQDCSVWTASGSGTEGGLAPGSSAVQVDGPHVPARLPQPPQRCLPVIPRQS